MKIDLTPVILILALLPALGGIGIDLAIGWPVGTVAIWSTMLALGPVFGLLVREVSRK